MRGFGVGAAGLLLGVVLVLSGCVGTGGRTEGDAPRFRSLTLQIEGGLAGLVREIRVDDSGRLRVRDRRRGLCAEGRLTTAELHELDALAAQVDFGRKIPPSAVFRDRCADCMNYALTLIGAGGEVRKRSWTSGTGPEPGPLQALVGRLAAWTERVGPTGSRRDCP